MIEDLCPDASTQSVHGQLRPGTTSSFTWHASLDTIVAPVLASALSSSSSVAFPGRMLPPLSALPDPGTPYRRIRSCALFFPDLRDSSLFRARPSPRINYSLGQIALLPFLARDLTSLVVIAGSPKPSRGTRCRGWMFRMFEVKTTSMSFFFPEGLYFLARASSGSDMYCFHWRRYSLNPKAGRVRWCVAAPPFPPRPHA